MCSQDLFSEYEPGDESFSSFFLFEIHTQYIALIFGFLLF